LALLIAKLMGRTITIESDSQRLRPEGSEVDRLLADATRAQDLLGWQAKVSLEDGLQKTIDWIQANMNRYRPGVYTV
jgi:nucleoside-diphosphate-sugar epimerase